MISVSRIRRFTPGAALAAGLALACLVAPLGSAPGAAVAGSGFDAGGSGSGDAAGSATGVDGLSGSAAAAAGGSLGPAGTAAGGAAGSTSTTPGALAAADSAAGDPYANSYQGVTATTVKWGSAAATNSCGGFDQSAVASSFGIHSNDALSYEVATEYFNKYPLVNDPLPPEIRAHVNPKTGYWGRHITRVFASSGGYACQDVGRANAVAMAEKDKVFGLIMPNNDGPEVPMSLVMAQHHLIHIGRWLTGPLFWKQRAPYFWDGVHGDGVRENIALGSWVCRDWVGGKAHDTGDVKVTGMPRKFGILYPDDPQFHEVAGYLQTELHRCGLHPKEYAIPFDLQTLEAQAQATVNRMIADGVTTILSVNDFLTRLLSSESATNQGWHPEWVLSGWGIGSYPGADKTVMEPQQAPKARGAGDAASIHTPAGTLRAGA
jgi:hypothetical protein